MSKIETKTFELIKFLEKYFISKDEEIAEIKNYLRYRENVPDGYNNGIWDVG